MRGPGRRCRCRSRVARTRSRSLLSARSQRPTVRPQCQRAGESGSGECRCGQACQSRLGSVQPPGIGPAGERPPRAVAQCGARRAVRPGAGVGVMYGRWTTARPLELRGPWISNVYRSPTCVPNSHGCGPVRGAVHPGAGVGVKAAVEATTPEKPSSTHQKATARLSRLPLSITSQGAAQNARIPRTALSVLAGPQAGHVRRPTAGPLAWDGGSRSDPLDPCLFRESP